MNPAVIVTRPADDASRWVTELRFAGWAAEALPLIDIEPSTSGHDGQALRLAWQSLPDYAACLFVSRNAVEFFFRPSAHTAGDTRKGDTPEPSSSVMLPLPPQVRWLAPGPGTVAALRAAGVSEAQIDAPPPDAGQFDSQALWQVVGQRDWRGRQVLIVRGDSPASATSSATTGAPARDSAAPGRDWITQQWVGAGAVVTTISVYRRCAPAFGEIQLNRAREASRDGSIWLFSSSEAVANLTEHNALGGICWHAARAVATHPRIAARARQAGWGVVVESRPALTDIGQALCLIRNQTVPSIESTPP